MTAEPATTWGVGAYSLIAERLEPAAQAVVDLARVSDSDRVLDIACGTGNAALLAARRGATVVGLDFEPTPLDIARARARTANLRVEWVEADVQSASLGPAAFSVVVSAFGVMYAPDHDAAAGALARCCAPGARLALAAWTPGGFMPAMGAVLAPYLPPPPPSGAPPSRWGDEPAVSELLERHGISIRATTTESLSLSLPGRAEAVDFLIRTAGHVLSEQPRLQREGRWQQLRDDLARLVAARDEGSDGVELRCEYLVVVAERA
ncbi:MAG: class I SAM-dependent methyltransferase [Solirubrobacteraceae bacterium]